MSASKDLLERLDRFDQTLGKFEPARWRSEFAILAADLEKRGEKLLAQDFREFSDHVLGDASDEVLRTLLFLEDMVHRNLRSLKEALQEAAKKIDPNAKTPQDKFASLLKEMDFKFEWPEPRVITRNPNVIRARQTSNTQLYEMTNQNNIEVRGWAIRRPKSETKKYELLVQKANKSERPLDEYRVVRGTEVQLNGFSRIRVGNFWPLIV